MDTEYKKWLAFIKEISRAWPVDDEYEVLAAYDAPTAEYNLDRYPTPTEWKRLQQAATTAQTGGIFASSERSELPCRE